MENQIENIDKDQLKLFTLLTDDQEKSKNDYIKYKRDIAIREYTKRKKIADFLEANGFEGHYLFNAKIEKISINYNVGSYREELKIEIEVEECLGGVFLIYDKYSSHDRKIINHKYSVDLEKGKINCYSLQGSTRYIKPETMLQKIIETNHAAVRAMNIHNEKISIIDYTVRKYSNLYPEAEVKKDTKWIENRYSRRGGETINVVKIKFKSGSYLSLGIGHEVDKEYIVERYNVVKKSLIESLDEFNNQK